MEGFLYMNNGYKGPSCLQGNYYLPLLTTISVHAGCPSLLLKFCLHTRQNANFTEPRNCLVEIKHLYCGYVLLGIRI